MLDEKTPAFQLEAGVAACERLSLFLNKKENICFTLSSINLLQ